MDWDLVLFIAVGVPMVLILWIGLGLCAAALIAACRGKL